ncbi:50S ribosomal protein L35ae [Candidatus Woesearchaeota archaeon]|nr:50S ribosomal protein L35ae [Candidatus Woesearchaeota archaeon]
MEGTIVNYRSSVHSQVQNQMVVVVKGVDSKKKASELVGKKVVWASPAKKMIAGEVRSAHGNSGALRVLFATGMPGQAVGQKVKIE